MNKLLLVAVLGALLICTAAAFGHDQPSDRARLRRFSRNSRNMVSKSSLLSNMENNLKRVYYMIQQLRSGKNNAASEERRRPSRRPRVPQNSGMKQHQSNENGNRRLLRRQSQRRPRRQQQEQSRRRTPAIRREQPSSQEKGPKKRRTQRNQSSYTSSDVSTLKLMDWAIKKFTKKGIPYKAFAPYNEKSGYSCSAFTKEVAKEAGVNLAAFSPLQFKAGQQVVSKSDLQTGDLVFWRFPTDKEWLKRAEGVPNHVGFYLGNGMILHSSGGKGPNVMKMTPAYERFYIGARRIFGSQFAQVAASRKSNSDFPRRRPRRTQRPTSASKRITRSPSVRRVKRVSQESNDSSSTMNSRELMAWAIKKYTGKGIPYKSSPPYNEKVGFGCSPFTSTVAKRVGINLPAYSPSQFQMGKKIAWNDMQVGDLIFWRFPTTQSWLKRPPGVPNHVGFYLGNGKILHSSGGRGPNVMTMTSSYKQYFIGARRILPQ